MPKSTRTRKSDPPSEDAPQPAPTPRDLPMDESAPQPPGPVSIQVAPDGFVTINVTPPVEAALAREGGLESITARSFSDWLRGEPPPEEVERGPGPVEEALDKLRNALKTIGEKVEDFAEDVTTLQVRTFVSDRLDRLDDQFFTTAEPRALTRVDLDGDTDVVVPLNEGQLDEALWRIHAAPHRA